MENNSSRCVNVAAERGMILDALKVTKQFTKNLTMIVEFNSASNASKTASNASKTLLISNLTFNVGVFSRQDTYGRKTRTFNMNSHIIEPMDI